MHNIHIIDVAIVILYFVICIGVGLYKYKSVTTLKEYTLGCRNFSDLVIATTLFATDIGAEATIGVVEKVYELGLFFVIPCICIPFFWLFVARIYGKNIDQFQDCMTISDIMAKLYGKTGRRVTNIASIISSIGVVAFQATAMGYILHYFFLIPVGDSTIICVLTLTLYSAFGGIRAVAYTDVFQFIIIILAIPYSMFYCIWYRKRWRNNALA